MFFRKAKKIKSLEKQLDEMHHFMTLERDTLLKLIDYCSSLCDSSKVVYRDNSDTVTLTASVVLDEVDKTKLPDMYKSYSNVKADELKQKLFSAGFNDYVKLNLTNDIKGNEVLTATLTVVK